MKKFASTTTLLFILLAIYWGFKSSMPTYKSDLELADTAFSTDRALEHVAQLSKAPHGVGFPAHSKAREYIVSEFQKMGLEASLQKGYTAGDWGNFSRAVNIVARIKGSENGKALLLLSHYDSSPHSALGASDAASGVATILEGVRAFLSENKSPKNDIILLISDAEELGLNGADLFVNKHPWAQDVGLALNFEARGSGGPSYMLLETNRGNRRLIEEFTRADPEYPVTNSLAYSISKMLPNDTDLTVFREDGDIEGLYFAFIDDHFDYHTVRDNYDRLDKNTLAHQGSYLMPLLHHFSSADLSDLKSLDDYVYFKVPFFKLVSYPFEWIWLIFGSAILLFLLLLVHGFRKKSLTIREITKGFLPLLIALTINGFVGFYGWTALKEIYPQYEDILHGFTYNGYLYISAFVLFSVGVCFWTYHSFKKITTANLLVAPSILWLFICWALSAYLQGGSFFIIPVYALLVSFMVVINQKRPSLYLLFLFALPALWIHPPFIKMLPVALGLKMMVATTLLTTLTFFLLLPIFGFYKRKKGLAILSLLVFFGYTISAHFNSGFTKENAKPTSLLYVLDADTDTAKWATYENQISDWTAQYIGKDKKIPEKLTHKTISSKYSSGFTAVAKAPLKEISPPLIETSRDTIIGKDRVLEICIKPQRKIHRLEIFTNDISISKAVINGVSLSEYYLQNRNIGKLVTHYISANDYTELQLTIPKDAVLELTLYEASNDLLDSPLFTIPPRPEDNIPMPFVLNDAIILMKTIRFE
ncbi:MAG: M28 family peptidase [Flavobacteriaceae bacterium]